MYYKELHNLLHEAVISLRIYEGDFTPQQIKILNEMLKEISKLINKDACLNEKIT